MQENTNELDITYEFDIIRQYLYERKFHLPQKRPETDTVHSTARRKQVQS